MEKIALILIYKTFLTKKIFFRNEYEKIFDPLLSLAKVDILLHWPALHSTFSSLVG